MLIAQAVSPGGPLELALTPVAVVASVWPYKFAILQNLSFCRALQVLGYDFAPGTSQVAFVFRAFAATCTEARVVIITLAHPGTLERRSTLVAGPRTRSGTTTPTTRGARSATDSSS